MKYIDFTVQSILFVAVLVVLIGQHWWERCGSCRALDAIAGRTMATVKFRDISRDTVTSVQTQSNTSRYICSLSCSLVHPSISEIYRCLQR